MLGGGNKPRADLAPSVSTEFVFGREVSRYSRVAIHRRQLGMRLFSKVDHGFMYECTRHILFERAAFDTDQHIVLHCHDADD